MPCSSSRCLSSSGWPRDKFWLDLWPGCLRPLSGHGSFGSAWRSLFSSVCCVTSRLLADGWHPRGRREHLSTTSLRQTPLANRDLPSLESYGKGEAAPRGGQGVWVFSLI